MHRTGGGLPQLEDIPDQYASAGELVRHAIDFGYAWAERGQGEPHWLDKWQAVLELEDCHRLDQALDYAQNLRQYAFVPRGIDLAGNWLSGTASFPSPACWRSASTAEPTPRRI